MLLVFALMKCVAKLYLVLVSATNYVYNYIQVMRKVQIYFGLSLLTVKTKQNWDCTTYCNHILHTYTAHNSYTYPLGISCCAKSFSINRYLPRSGIFHKGVVFKLRWHLRKVSDTENVNDMKIFTYNSKGILSPMSIVGKIWST